MNSNTLAWVGAGALVLAQTGDLPHNVVEWISLAIALLMAYLSWRKQRA